MNSIVLTALMIALVLVVLLTAWAIVRYLHTSEGQADRPTHGNTGGPALYNDDQTIMAYESPIDITKPAAQFVFEQPIDVTEPSPEFVAGKESRPLK